MSNTPSDSVRSWSNTAPGLLAYLGERLQVLVSADDLVAYVAAIASHPAFTERFRTELKSPGGIRVPLTSIDEYWTHAVAIGQRVIWLHTYGERFADPRTGRPAGPPRLPAAKQPRVVSPIVDRANELPEAITYSEVDSALLVGKGRIAPVSPAVYSYEVSGMRIVPKWFNYRSAKPRGRRGSPLDDIRPVWDAEMTAELLDLLNVLGLLVELEPEQSELLDRVLAGPLIDVEQLTCACVLPVPPQARRPPSRHGMPDLWQSG